MINKPIGPMLNKTLVFELLRRLNARPATKKVIEAAYNAGYEPKSDGITLGSQFEYADYEMKNPLGVAHDWLYFMGIKNPFYGNREKDIPTEAHYRRWADSWFKEAMYDFGYWAFALLYYIALRLFALRAWQFHRSRGHPIPVDQLPDVR